MATLNELLENFHEIACSPKKTAECLSGAGKKRLWLVFLSILRKN